jgi:hypothetical protein
LLVWIAVVVWWAARPVTDAVPTGLVKGVETSQKVQCDSPLSGNTTSPDPLPTLPKGRAYERTPCEMPIQNDRWIFWADVALVIVGVVILVKTWRPPADPESSDGLALA